MVELMVELTASDVILKVELADSNVEFMATLIYSETTLELFINTKIHGKSVRDYTNLG